MIEMLIALTGVLMIPVIFVAIDRLTEIKIYDKNDEDEELDDGPVYW